MFENIIQYGIKHSHGKAQFYLERLTEDSHPRAQALLRQLSEDVKLPEDVRRFCRENLGKGKWDVTKILLPPKKEGPTPSLIVFLALLGMAYFCSLLREAKRIVVKKLRINLRPTEPLVGASL